MAKKAKGFGKLVKQPAKQSQAAKEAKIAKQSLDRLEKKVKKGPMADIMGGLVREPAGHEKMSTVLEEFIEPYLDYVSNIEQHRRLLTIAIVAWNAAILPEEKRQEIIKESVKNLPGTTRQDQQDLQGIINEMMIRKLTYFGEIQRSILDFELQGLGKKRHLSVVSTLAEPPK